MNSSGLSLSLGNLPLIVQLRADIYDLIGEKTSVN